MTSIFSFGRGRVFALVLSVFICSSFVYGQTSQSASQNTSVENSASASENSTQSPYWSVSEPANQVQSPSTFGLFVKMVFSLLIVIGLVYLFIRILRKNSGVVDSDDSFLRKVAHLSIGAGKSVQIVTLLDKAYVIGVSDNSINLISEIGDKELVDSLNLMADKNQNRTKPRSFSDVLDIFISSGSKTKNAFSDKATFTDSLRRQRERFNRDEQ
ncbi:MAG: flagellar biosynthetic protein FliO [Treponema sp.]|nr:flagellar biosynthetic protein FliO [Candidatus Treponema equifaecale]